MSLLLTSSLLVVKGYFAYQVKGIDVLYKRKCHLQKLILNRIFKELVFAYSSIIVSKIIVGMSCENAIFLTILIW